MLGQSEIIHDGEYYFLEARKGDAWTVQDAKVEARLAEIRAANGGKPLKFSPPGSRSSRNAEASPATE